MQLSDLRDAVPPTVVRVASEEPAQHREVRAEQSMLRHLGTPCEVGGDMGRPFRVIRPGRFRPAR